jgi:Domain of unknown function (DUF5666)
MQDATAQTPDGRGEAALPRPQRGSRWRWSRPRRALAAGGVLAAVVGLGVGAGSAAGAATTTPSRSGGAAHGAPPGGLGRPTVAGQVTAVNGNDITVETGTKSSVTVVYSSGTTFTTGGGTSSSASALKVGDFIGVTGTEDSDGSVTATALMIGRPPKGRPGGAPKGGTPPSGAGAPGA